MNIQNAIKLYLPLLTAQDRLIRRPIAGWRLEQLREVQEILQTGDLQLHRLASRFNQLALLEAYQGNNAAALALCDGQIRFWQKFAERSGKKRFLGFVVQPWINIMRLDRWQQKLDYASSLYTELSPQRRNEYGALSAKYQIGMSYAQLCELDAAIVGPQLLDVTYWLEYGKQLLASVQWTQLQGFLQFGLRSESNSMIKSSLLELLFIQQIKMGKYENAALSLEKLNFHATHPYFLHFAMLRLLLAAVRQPENCKPIVAEMMPVLLQGKVISQDGYGLNLLHSITRSFEQLGLHAEELLLLHKTAQMALALQDEAILFEVMQRQLQLGMIEKEALLQKFQLSQYAMIQKKLELPELKKTPMEDSGVVMAMEKLLDWDFFACQDLIQGKLVQDFLVA